MGKWLDWFHRDRPTPISLGKRIKARQGPHGDPIEITVGGVLVYIIVDREEAARLATDLLVMRWSMKDRKA